MACAIQMILLWFLAAVAITDITAVEVSFKHADYHTGTYGKRPSPKNKIGKTGTLPTVFIVGAQKGGSSSLYELMQQHPQLCRTFHKENHYFDHPDNYAYGVDYYKSLFTDTKCDNITGTHFMDGTPILHYPSVWQRIYDTYNQSIALRDSLKFIVLLREPVARDYSWYQHATRTDIHLGQKLDQIKTMNETFNFNVSFYRKGRYIEQLQAFTAVFQRKQLLVLSSEGIFEDTAGTLERIRKFIGIKRSSVFDLALPHDDHLNLMDLDGTAACITAHVPALDCWIRDAMFDHFEVYNTVLYTWLNETRAIADPNEPPFWPLFSNPKIISCVTDSRLEYNKILSVDAKMRPPKTNCSRMAH